MQIHINICKNVEKYIKKNSSNQESEKIKTGPKKNMTDKRSKEWVLQWILDSKSHL